MSKIDPQELEWFGQEFQAKITPSQRSVKRMTRHYESLTEPYTWHVETEQCYDVTLSETDLSNLINLLTTAHKHEELQKRFPGIREAWMNYMAVVSLTAYEYDWRNNPL